MADVLWKIQLHMAYLSAVMLLLIPVLIVFARRKASSSEIRNTESKLAFMARLAVDTALVHVRFASVRLDEGISRKSLA